MRPQVDHQPGLDPKPYYAAAFGIGIAAAGVMTILMWLTRLAGWADLDLAVIIGTASIFTDDPNAGAWVQGLTVMLTFGGLFALVYAWIFAIWPHHRARAWIGALTGLIHALVGGLLLWQLMPALHRWLGDHYSGAAADPRLADPGFMAANYGSSAVAAFIAFHIVFGTIIGAWMHYAPVATRYLGELEQRDHDRKSLGRLRTT